MAEIRDDRLFTQPEESHHGECPICCLPLSLDESKSTMNACCSKLICDGCCYADDLRMEEEGLEQRCAYCREILPVTDEEVDQYEMKRVKANDPAALFKRGVKCHVEGDYEKAFEYSARAAKLGNADAHFNLSFMYREGLGVEKNTKKVFYHWEEAAIGGHPQARHNLGYFENQNGMHERAMRHFIIAAKLGLDSALEEVKEGFAAGYVSKEDFEAALRGHQAAVDATKSTQRDAAEEYYKLKNRE